MFQSGDTIDQYCLLEVLGSGSYGVVFAAENTVSKQNCALKIIPLCGRAGTRELRALRQYHDIEHPGLLKIHHSGIEGDYLYYTMDRADGKLAETPLSPSQLRDAAIKTADALAALHEHGLIHRDIKPDNLFILHGDPLIGDIGLVTADCGASLTGTPGFLPPEVRHSGAALSEYSDLYALAKSFYCLLSGNPPMDYPKYTGPMDTDASILLQAVLNVCDGNGTITSAAGFRDFLLGGSVKKPRHRRRIVWTGILLLLAGAAAAALFLCRTPLMPSRGEQMFAAVQKAETYSSAEQTAIDRQEQVYAALKNEAREQAQKQYPARENGKISIEIVLNRQQFYETYLADSVRKQAEKSPAFHCFFILRKEAEQASSVLYGLEGHPEQAETYEKDFQIWQQKYAIYCQKRDDLL